MTAEEALRQKFTNLEELLQDIGAGSKTWDDFWPAFFDLRAFLRRVDSSLWRMALSRTRCPRTEARAGSRCHH